MLAFVGPISRPYPSSVLPDDLTAFPRTLASTAAEVTVAEVIVVGAGPGGSAAAAVLAREGRSVVLLEAAKFPRDKVCGDVLLPEMKSWVAALGADWERLTHDAVRVEGVRYTVPSGRTVAGSFRDGKGRLHPWRILPRRLLDERLARHAQGCGAQLLEEHRVVAVHREGEVNMVRVRTPQGERRFRAPLVIAADGAGSRIARGMGLRPDGCDRPSRRLIAMRTYAPAPADLAGEWMEVLADRRLLPGCGWMIPAPGGLVNVGLGMVADDRQRQDLRLQAVLEELFAHRLEWSAAPPASGWRLPTGDGRRVCVADGLLLVGDAAGMIDPFTGHGIHTAVRSGMLAAQAAAAALDSGEPAAAQAPLQRYERLWRREMGNDFRFGRLLQRIHSSVPLVELAAWRASHSQRWADRFMGLVGHAVPRREILAPGFLRAALGPQGRWPPPSSDDRFPL